VMVLLDGGMGRALHEMGVSLDAPLWSARAFLERPEAIEQAHRDFIAAGAEVITTNSYALTDYYLRAGGLLDRKEDLLRMAYALAQAARDKQSPDKSPRIAASIPPLNESYRPDLVERRQCEDEYPRLIAAAVDGGADILLGETLSTLLEAEIILRSAGKYDIPRWISFTVGADGRLRSGESIEEALTCCREGGAEAILFNCSMPPAIDRALDHLIPAMGTRAMPFGAYANRFEQVPEDFTLKGGINRINIGLSCSAYNSWVRRWIERGASIVGGCCGIGPEYIAEIRELAFG
jgi:S-methylmethionine-dependent homocysteine/selenocysteine methylase